MRRIRVRREEGDWFGIAAATVLGLLAGTVGGLLAGEFLGAVNVDGVKDAMGRRRRARVASADEQALEHAAATALEEHPTTRALGLEVRALGGDVLELTGTVSDHGARDLATRVARGAAPHILIINRVLVAEDDLPEQPVTSNVG